MNTKILFENFDLIAQSPNGIQSLRDLVLRLAIRGKLVAQNNRDDSAQNLMKEIESIKMRLANDGQIRLPKPYPDISEKEIPFGIPPNWTWARIGEFCQLQTGATPSRAKPQYFGGDVRWLVSGDINQGLIYECEGRITEDALKNSNCKVLPVDSVLIALNGQGKTRATVAILKTPAACNQSLIAMTPFVEREVLTPYLFWNLRGRYKEIREITGQNQRRGLNMELVGSLVVSIPPLDEQKRIGKKVGELNKLCDDLEAKAEISLKKLDELCSALIR